MNELEYQISPLHKKFFYKLGEFFRKLPLAVTHFFVKIYRAVLSLGKRIGREAKEIFHIFKDGSVTTKLSFIFMGFGCLFRGQIIRGLLYIAIECLFILFIVFFAAKYLAKLDNLGDIAMIQTNPGSEFPVYKIVDSSFEILLFSVVSIFVIVVFFFVYLGSLKAVSGAEKNLSGGKRNSTFPEDVKGLLDKNYHKTLLTLPMIGILLFTVMPLITMILMAFTNFDRAHQPPGNLFTWVGFQNFKNLFSFQTNIGGTFFSLLGWTLIWAVFATFTNYIFGMILALMINKKGIRFKKFWRTIFVITIAVPQFVTLLLMSKILADEGILNKLLMNAHIITKPIQFLTVGLNAKITVIIVNMWVGIPYTMLITTGILMNIPESLYESARIDGASAFAMFAKITLPYMLFVTGPYLITQFIGNINNFNLIYLLSAGGPMSLKFYNAGETDLLVTWLYKLTVNQSEYNLASVIGIMVFIVCAVFSLVTYNRSAAVKKEEEFQ